VASVLPARQEHAGRQSEDTNVAMFLWEKYGLLAPGWFRSHEGEQKYARLSRATRFRLALEEGGGILSTFGEFLSGRADLLPGDYLHELRKIRRPAPSDSLHKRDLPTGVSALKGIRATPACDVYSGVYEGTPVVLELYRDRPVRLAEKKWEQFRRVLRGLKNSPESSVSSDTVFDQFFRWVELLGDIDRRRTMIANLRNVPADCLCRFPRLMLDLQTADCLAYEQLQGPALRTDLVPNSDIASANIQAFAEAYLEQVLLLSLIDAEGKLENLVVLPDGHLGFNTLPAWISVPVDSNQDLLQYMASSIAGNSPRAAQMLLRMSGASNSHKEQVLLDRLASLQPELKIHEITPELVSVFENNWRALAHSGIPVPLFLHLFHRNVVVLGQYNGQLAPLTDALADALWPVIGRVVRFHTARSFSTGKISEWLVVSSLFSMTAVRQLAVNLEDIREDVSDIESVLDVKRTDSREVQLNQRTVALLRSAIILVILLFFLQLSLSPAPGHFSFLNKAVTLVAAVALCISVASIR